MNLTGRWPQPLVTLATLVIIGFAARTAGAQQRTLTGHVEADVSGEPIAGAVITVVGTNTGTETAADGMFSLTVPAGADQLSIRAIGYRSSEITLSAGQTTIIIALERDAFRLDEIVVTGRATGVARRNQASSVARLVADDLVKVSNASLEQSLQGKIPGAMIRSNSPAPGGGASINLRGVTSIIGNNSPLYVMDGLIISDAATQPGVNTITGAFPDGRFTTTQGNAVNRIADLNPDDIESVEVLKGASAAAIYGSKAAGGVIIITTKRGQQGAPRFHVRQQFGTSQASRKVGFRTFESLAEAQSVYSNAADYWTGEVYDHEDLLIGGRPLSYETSANFSGGSSDLRYFASGLVRHEGGVIRNTFGDKQAVRMNLEKFVNDRLTVNLGTQFIRTESDRGIHQNENTGNTMYGALTGTPTFIDLRQRPDGTFPINPYSGSNPFETVEKVKNNETVWRFVGTGSADLEILQGDVHDLTLSAVGGVDWFQQKNNVYAPPDAQFEPNDGLPGTVVISQTQNLNLNLNFFAVHGYEGSGFNLTSSVGTQYESVDYDVNRNRGQNLVGGLRNVSAGTVQTSLQQLLRTEDFGFFLQEEALIGDRLFLTAGIRGDQSSSNSDDQAIYWYPKAAASYTFPLETEVVRDLKVRMAYGQTGNQPRYGQKFTVLVPGNVTGVGTYQIQGSTAASDLRPERQAEIEGGFDATLLDGRIRLEATVYEKTISDLLLSRTLLPSSGFGSLVSNGGKMRTRGVEASLVGNFFQGGAIEWQPMVNFSAWRCTILELPGGEFRPGGFGTSFGERRLAEGESCTQIIASDTLEAGPVKIGDDRPDFTMGISNSVQYGNLGVYALLDWQQGGRMMNFNEWLIDAFANSDDYLVGKDGKLSGQERFGLWGGGQSDLYFQDASYLKLREASLSYRLPIGWVQSWWSSAEAMQLTVRGRNLFMITPFGDGEPENSQTPTGTNLNNGGPAGLARWDLWAYPSTRSVWLSVDFTF